MNSSHRAGTPGVPPSQARFRRKSFWRRMFTPRRVFLLSLLVLVGLGAFGYYYQIYSKIIDDTLKGKVFVRASGIYAAPLRVSTDSNIKKSQIIAHLDRAGYLNPEKTGDANRGKYIVKGDTLEITPSRDSAQGAWAFSPIRLRFAGESIKDIYALDTKQSLTECFLEPELLTSLNQNKEKRTIIEYKDIPKNLKNAIVAVEDRNFEKHRGIDFRGLARAIYHNFTTEDGTVQGASTITQQLVKNYILTPERTIKRKLEEAFISILLEVKLSKEQIMQMYCNQIYLGQDGNYSINGVGEAARFYFNKDLTDLNLQECALMAGIIRGPGYYSPFQHRERAKERRLKVLNDMLEETYITQTQFDAVKDIDLGVKSRTVSSNADAPYFLDFLQQKLAEHGKTDVLKAQSLRIYSSIDMELQRLADKAFRDGIDRLLKTNKGFGPKADQLQGALVALNPKTGEVLAMVGGRDYSKTQLNRATEARRQPGSVFKPIVYTTAMMTGEGLPCCSEISNAITPSTLFMDAKQQFLYEDRVYEPDNFGGSYSNKEITVREALTKSKNTITVRIAECVGYDKVARTAEKLGLPMPREKKPDGSTKLKSFPSVALGVTEATPLEVARAYTAFPNLGMWVEPAPFTTLIDTRGQLEKITPKRERGISAPVASVMTHLLEGPIARGTAVKAQAVGAKALAGKTGTSRDAWFAGFTPNLVCVVYVGFDDNSQLGITGGEAALPIWVDFMKGALALRPDLGGEAFPDTPGVEKVKVDLDSGKLATEECSNAIDGYYIAGTIPEEYCDHNGLPSLLPEGMFPGDEDNIPPRPEEPTQPASDRKSFPGWRKLPEVIGQAVRRGRG